MQFENKEMRRLSEDFIFTNPFMDHEMNRYNPLLSNVVVDIWENRLLKSEIEKIKHTFMTAKEAVLHGDLHTGSIMVTENNTKVIDAEFAFYGPMGFDIGAAMANVLLNYASHGKDKSSQSGYQEYRSYLLSLIKEIWDWFEEELREFCKQRTQSTKLPDLIRFKQSLFHDSIGFAGCEMMRRVIGTSHVEDLERIEDAHVRAEAEQVALFIGKNLILERNSIQDMNQLISFITKLEGKRSRTM